MTDDGSPEDVPFPRAEERSQLLNYFSQQNTSHSVILLTGGLLYAAFLNAILPTIVNACNLVSLHVLGIVFLLAIAGMVSIYAFLRLLIWAKLAGILSNLEEAINLDGEKQHWIHWQEMGLNWYVNGVSTRLARKGRRYLKAAYVLKLYQLILVSFTSSWSLSSLILLIVKPICGAYFISSLLLILVPAILAFVSYVVFGYSKTKSVGQNDSSTYCKFG